MILIGFYQELVNLGNDDSRDDDDYGLGTAKFSQADGWKTLFMNMSKIVIVKLI